jgi:enamine deaminase RidA (YjgF/YER057c/UK114 family)
MRVCRELGRWRVTKIQRFDSSHRMSRAVAHGDTLYVSGLTADDLTEDVRGQTIQILAKIDKYLAMGGSDKSRLLSANIWLSDIAAFDQMNAVWDAWVDRANPPARATVESRLAGERYLVEIMVTAARDPS